MHSTTEPHFNVKDLESEVGFEPTYNGFAGRRMATLLLAHGTRRGTPTPNHSILNRAALAIGVHGQK
jgi:hypothetical protein